MNNPGIMAMKKALAGARKNKPMSPPKGPKMGSTGKSIGTGTPWRKPSGKA